MRLRTVGEVGDDHAVDGAVVTRLNLDRDLATAGQVAAVNQADGGRHLVGVVAIVEIGVQFAVATQTLGCPIILPQLCHKSPFTLVRL